MATILHLLPEQRPQRVDLQLPLKATNTATNRLLSYQGRAWSYVMNKFFAPRRQLDFQDQSRLMTMELLNSIALFILAGELSSKNYTNPEVWNQLKNSLLQIHHNVQAVQNENPHSQDEISVYAKSLSDKIKTLPSGLQWFYHLIFSVPLYTAQNPERPIPFHVKAQAVFIAYVVLAPLIYRYLIYDWK